MKRLVAALSILMMVSLSFAQDESIDPTQTKKYAMPNEINTLSIHPISMIVFAAIDILPMYVALTYERNLAPKNALIITPNYMRWSLESGGDKLSLNSIGAGVGVRRYLSKPVSGVYLQTKADFSYTNASVTYAWSNDKDEGSGLVFSILAYVGVKGKWDNISMFIDAGIGKQFTSATLKTSNSDFEASTSGSGLASDFNFGVGYSF